MSDELTVNSSSIPLSNKKKKSDIDLTVAGTKDAINMVEAGADEIPEDVMLEAIMFGHQEIIRLIEFQEKVIAEVGVAKKDFQANTAANDLTARVEAKAKDRLVEAIQTEGKHARDEAIDAVKDDVKASFEEEGEEEDVLKQVASVLENMVKAEVRRLITKEKTRPDGRKPDEIRPLSSRVNVLPRTHGSGLFTRGQTQALSVCTLGALGDVQILDGLDLEESKRFMHHYNFPQYSVGETGPIRGPGRREIGHGALGERALEKVVPTEKDFHIRFVLFPKCWSQMVPHHRQVFVQVPWP